MISHPQVSIDTFTEAEKESEGQTNEAKYEGTPEGSDENHDDTPVTTTTSLMVAALELEEDTEDVVGSGKKETTTMVMADKVNMKEKYGEMKPDNIGMREKYAGKFVFFLLATIMFTIRACGPQQSSGGDPANFSAAAAGSLQ